MSVIALIVSATSDIVATPLSIEASYEFNANIPTPEEPTQPKFELQRPSLGLTTLNTTAQSITLAARTLPRTLRYVPRAEVSSVAVRSIDSTLSASRYGLYNHKILFYAQPRHYYLNGLVRLII